MIGRVKAFLAGFLLGVFVAPRSGRASREKLKERIAEFFDAGDRRLEELEDRLAERRSDPLDEWDDEGLSREVFDGEPPA